jgi:hypothetical protein
VLGDFLTLGRLEVLVQANPWAGSSAACLPEAAQTAAGLREALLVREVVQNRVFPFAKSPPGGVCIGLLPSESKSTERERP